MTITVQKWGNSLGVRIPKGLAQSAGLEKGSELKVTSRGGKIVLEAIKVPTLTELLSQIGPGDQPKIIDWGKPVGKEAW